LQTLAQQAHSHITCDTRELMLSFNSTFNFNYKDL